LPTGAKFAIKAVIDYAIAIESYTGTFASIWTVSSMLTARCVE